MSSPKPTHPFSKPFMSTALLCVTAFVLRRRLYLTLATVGVVATVITLVNITQEPQYQRRPPSHWVIEYVAQNPTQSDQTLFGAIESIGTNGLPYLCMQLNPDCRVRVLDFLGTTKMHPELVAPFLRRKRLSPNQAEREAASRVLREL